MSKLLTGKHEWDKIQMNTIYVWDATLCGRVSEKEREKKRLNSLNINLSMKG